MIFVWALAGVGGGNIHKDVSNQIRQGMYTVGDEGLRLWKVPRYNFGDAQQRVPYGSGYPEEDDEDDEEYTSYRFNTVPDTLDIDTIPGNVYNEIMASPDGVTARSYRRVSESDSDMYYEVCFPNGNMITYNASPGRSSIVHTEQSYGRVWSDGSWIYSPIRSISFSYVCDMSIVFRSLENVI